ncbi:sensor histidine kinase [Massilia horti]|uniref:histidine kinase n=1 Tax=Massilia horti TaxID=2562153 RepID=A0A4Y9SNC9_9BURK|nr:two-component regulator propeller domain-containing protein [Massilia horti]TFW27961.1 hypothetical protein E4O92_22640 [Massilia horti]
MLGLTFARIARWSMGTLLAVACATAFGMTSRSLRFERLSIEQGLAQESVLTILQDRQGFMWFGTQAGLNRYDGYKITVFRNDPRDPGSIVDNYVNASFEDASGRLWFGTKGGLTRFDPATGRFVHYAPPGAARKLHNQSVNAIAPDGEGGLWLATGDGLNHFDPASGHFVTLRHDPRDPSSLRNDRVNALAVDNTGAVWVGTADGLDRLARGARHFEHFAIERASDARRNSVQALAMGPRDTLWVGTGSGLQAWHLGGGAPTRRHLDARDGMNDQRVLALYVDRGANVWVGTDLEGLKWLDPTTGRFVSYRNEALDPHSLSDNQVSSIWVDRTGTLWVGTLFGGANRTDLASGGFSRFTHASANIGNGKVRAIVGDPDGRLWLGTTGGGLIRIDPRTSHTEQIRASRGGLPDDTVTALARAPGRLWVGTSNGLAWLDPATGRFTQVMLDRSADAEDRFIQALRIARNGNLWAVTRGGLFSLSPDGRTRSWSHHAGDPNSLGEDYGYALLEAADGAIWIATANGLDRFDEASGKFTHFRHDPADSTSLRHDRVYSLLESARGDLWVGTAGGLQRLERDKHGKVTFRLFRVSSGPEPVPIGAMLEDASGMLWVSTTQGISRLDPATGQLKYYTAKDGLIDGSYFVGSAWHGADGQLHFGGVRGLTSFMPEAIRDNPYPPVVAITDFQVANRSRPLGGAREVTLNHRESVFTIQFAALHYADPGGNRYAYQLAGFDEGWADADASKPYATYTNLDPGQYVFRVVAANKDGVWSEQPTTLRITIAPPFWKTWWFRTLALVVALSAAYTGYRLRVRALVQQKQTLEHEVAERTGELRLEKEEAEQRRQEVERQKEVVEQAHRDISRLSAIGRKLTANLDSEAIMGTLYEHVHELMDASVFAIVIGRPERGLLAYPFAVVGGRRCTPFERPAAQPHQLAAWCINHGSEVFIEDIERQCRDFLPGARPEEAARVALPCADVPLRLPRSLMFVPILVGRRVLGAVTVQSFAPAAYRPVQLDMLRTLAAYVGVAFDNADAYRRLKETQAQLAAQERLASLGSLVAGVAHELNTPIGNSLLMASTLQEKTAQMATRFEDASLRRSELASWIADSREASGLITRSLHSAAELVNSFRQVSVDQASAQRRRFELAQVSQEIAATIMNKVRREGHLLELRVPDGIVMNSFPGPLGQVLINFVNNSLLHAFDEPGGQMQLSAFTPVRDRVRIEFHDNGRGIAREHLGRIFDPFFTTRMGQGGTGLGLNIVYNIVTSLLKGTVRVESEPGQGTTFILDLPLDSGAIDNAS